jgi:hypothetical protein
MTRTRQGIPAMWLSMLLLELKLLEELTCRARDIHSARRTAFTVLDAFHNAGWLGALRAVCALVCIHDLLSVAGLGNLCHNNSP